MVSNIPLLEKFYYKIHDSETTVLLEETPVPTLEESQGVAGLVNDGLNKASSANLLDNFIASDDADHLIGTEDGFRISVDDNDVKNPTDTSFSLENITHTTLPRLGGIIGYKVAPFEGEESLVGVDVSTDVTGRFLVTKAAPGEDLGENGYKLEHKINTDLHVYTETVEQPLTANSAIGFIQNDAVLPQFSYKKNVEFSANEAIDEVKSQYTALTEKDAIQDHGVNTGEISPVASIEVVDNDPFEHLNVDGPSDDPYMNNNSLVDAKITFSGEYQVNADINVEVTHELTVSPEDYERVKAELDGEEIYNISISGSVTVYNPGTSYDDLSGKLYTHVGLDDATISSDLNEHIALASLMGDSGKEYLAEIEEEQKTNESPKVIEEQQTLVASSAEYTIDDVKVAQASCNLLLEDGSKLLKVDGDPGPQTQKCSSLVLGREVDESADWKAIGEEIQEQLPDNQVVADKMLALAKDVDNLNEDQACMFQAGTDIDVNCVIGDESREAAQGIITEANNVAPTAEQPALSNTAQAPSIKNISESFQMAANDEDITDNNFDTENQGFNNETPALGYDAATPC